MKIIFISPTDDPVEWTRTLQRLMPELEISIWPEVEDPAAIRVALAWKPPAGVLKRFPNLELIHGLGMGIDYLFDDPELPDVPIARLVDDNLIEQMSEYVCLEALRHHRLSDEYEHLQRQSRWQRLPPPNTSRRTVGILGMGAIGSDTAGKLMVLGFPVIGWSRTPKSVAGAESFHGPEGLGSFLARSRILACLLPLTPETEGIINRDTLAQLPEGAYVINCARGGHMVEEDLLEAIDSGHIAGATLDVFRQEPLPPEHPFWKHPKVRITPHIAGLTNAWAAAPQIVENIRRVRDGKAILNRVDRKKGY